MGMLILLLVLTFFGTIVAFIFTRKWSYFWSYVGINSLLCLILWAVISGLIGVIISSSASIAPVEPRYVQQITEYNIVPLHLTNPVYPEDMYIESFKDNSGYDKYRFAYEQDEAYYTKVISPAEVMLGYCAEGVNPSVRFLDVDFDTKLSRFVFWDTFCDYYDIKIPFGTIYIKPN